MPKRNDAPEAGIALGGKRKAVESVPREVINRLVKRDQAICAAEMMDWQQVVLNGGPPCFHISSDDDLFCGRAKRWHEPGREHKYVSLADLLGEVAGRVEGKK